MLISILIFVRLAEHKRDLPPLRLIQLRSRVELHLCSVAQVLIALTLCQWRQTTTPSQKTPTGQLITSKGSIIIIREAFCCFVYGSIHSRQEASITQPVRETEKWALLSRRGEKRYRKWGRERLQALTCTQQRQDVDTHTVSSEPNHLRCVYPFLKGY